MVKTLSETQNVLLAEMGLADSAIVKDINLAGAEHPDLIRMRIVRHIMAKAKMATSEPLLPAFFNIKGKPMTLDRHFPFAPLFRARFARLITILAGRQLGKSQTLAARGVISSVSIPNFTTLCVTPLYEQIRRFSNNYVRPLIETSPFKTAMLGDNSMNNVLQRTFRNFSQMIFSFAYLDAERTRGVSADLLQIDEVQNIEEAFLPVIREVLSGSDWGRMELRAGTPLTLDNTSAKLFGQSSQAQLMIKCQTGGCNYWNVPALSHDLEAITGPLRDDISDTSPAIVCRKCRKPIDPRRHGRWVHAIPSRRWEHVGLHIPQQIMPIHYANPDNWKILLAKRDGFDNTPKFRYYNEVCGEPFDSGSKVLTKTDLVRASCLPWSNQLEQALAQDRTGYLMTALGCDWGGGGADELSLTVYAVLGILPNGEIHTLFAYRSRTPHDFPREAAIAMRLATLFSCKFIAHDYTGVGGELREHIIVDAGFPRKLLISCALVGGASGEIMAYKPATKAHPRDHYRIDKPRSLHLVCNQIRTGRLKFFKFDEDQPDGGLISDFLALAEEQTDSSIGGTHYRIVRSAGKTDDFAHAVNFAACGLWRATNTFPKLGELAYLQMTPQLEAELAGWSVADIQQLLDNN